LPVRVAPSFWEEKSSGEIKKKTVTYQGRRWSRSLAPLHSKKEKSSDDHAQPRGFEAISPEGRRPSALGWF